MWDPQSTCSQDIYKVFLVQLVVKHADIIMGSNFISLEKDTLWKQLSHSANVIHFISFITLAITYPH